MLDRLTFKSTCIAVGMQIATASLEDSVAVTYKSKCSLIIQ